MIEYILQFDIRFSLHNLSAHASDSYTRHLPFPIFIQYTGAVKSRWLDLRARKKRLAQNLIKDRLVTTTREL